MQRKIIKYTIIFCVIILLCVGGFFGYRYFVSNNNSEELVDNTPTPTVTPIFPEHTQEPEPTSTPTKEFEFDDRITITIGGDDYVEEDVPLEEQFEDWVLWNAVGCLNYDFSNGFVFIDSDNIDAAYANDEEAIAMCSDKDFRIIVKELDPINCNVWEEIENILNTYGLVYYAEIGQPGVPKDAKFELGEGLDDYVSVIGQELQHGDPTLSIGDGTVQLVADYMDECAYGPVRYVCLYNKNYKTFDAYAYITCERDRLLLVNVKGTILSRCWSYVLEATNDCIKLIK